jgi:putative membrane protein
MEMPQEDPRVRFAAERTFLAWIRTGLAMMGFGFIVARFGMFLREMTAARGTPLPHTLGISVWVGSALILLGVAANIITAFQHARTLRRLRSGLALVPERWSLAILVAIVLSVIGMVMTAYVITSAR